jgi:hypothetical protein
MMLINASRTVRPTIHLDRLAIQAKRVKGDQIGAASRNWKNASQRV